MPVAKITGDRNQANLPQDLERYCQYALKLGADEARVVDASNIPMEERLPSSAGCPFVMGITTGGNARPMRPSPLKYDNC